MALSQLNPQIIGAEMEHGFAGSYARQPDMIVVTRPVGEKEPPEARRRSVRAHHQEHFAPQCCRGRL